MPSNSHLILCHPVLLLPSIFPSIRVFSNESSLHMRWPKYWNFSISTSNEYSGLISFRMDLLYLLAEQGTLKSLLQHYSSKASILWHSALFTVQLSRPYMTTGKIIAWTRRTFVENVMSLLFNMLSRLVITFLPRSKHLLISRLQSPSAVIFEPRKMKSATVSIVSPSICHEVMGPDAMILVFWMLSFKPTFSLSSFTLIKRLFSSSLVLQRRQCQPTPVFLPGKSHGWRSLVGSSPLGHGESDRTERLCFHFSFHALEKEMETQSSVPAWRIPGMAEPAGLLSMGSHRVGHDWSDLVAVAASVLALYI